MAGMDWFRWHHGSVNDPKFQLVAKKAGASVAEVLAVWACLLEAASSADDRGDVGGTDFEALDCALGLTDGKSAFIYERMCERGLLDAESGRVSSWDKRQPKRERDDDKSTLRVQAFRQRQKDETPRNASETPETPREEKSREEEKKDPPKPPKGADGPGFAEFWTEYPNHKAKANAVKAWERVPVELHAEIMAAVRVQAKSSGWVKDGGQFVPHAATWLNGKRWEDTAAQVEAAVPAWLLGTPFSDVFEASNAGCFAHNVAKFRTGAPA